MKLNTDKRTRPGFLLADARPRMSNHEMPGLFHQKFTGNIHEY